MPPPLASARWMAAWIALPSADGSLQGTPISTMSAPASAAARISRLLVSSSGSCAVR
jgi:hypothetical protein